MDSRLEIVKIDASKGRGVVARKRIKAGTVLDVAQVLLITPLEWTNIKQTRLYDYTFEWSGDGDNITYALALSAAEFINHSYQPNARYDMDHQKRTITFSTIKDIADGEEVTVNYNGDEDRKDPLWFDVKA
jgi:SET domain-containing protein